MQETPAVGEWIVPVIWQSIDNRCVGRAAVGGCAISTGHHTQQGRMNVECIQPQTATDVQVTYAHRAGYSDVHNTIVCESTPAPAYDSVNHLHGSKASSFGDKRIMNARIMIHPISRRNGYKHHQFIRSRRKFRPSCWLHGELAWSVP